MKFRHRATHCLVHAAKPAHMCLRTIPKPCAHVFAYKPQNLHTCACAQSLNPAHMYLQPPSGWPARWLACATVQRVQLSCKLACRVAIRHAAGW
eukprot:299980-Chlamydomonas_euryale.AAC.3